MTITYHSGDIIRGTAADRTGGTWTNLQSGYLFVESDTQLIYYWNGTAWSQTAGAKTANTYLIEKVGSNYFVRNSTGGTVGSSNTDTGALLNALQSSLVDGDTISFTGGITYSGSTQYLNTNKKRINYNGNGATISGFTMKLNGGSNVIATGYCTFRDFNFSGANAGLIFDNTFAPAVEHCTFDTCAVGISYESSNKWTEFPSILYTHFQDCTKSIVFKTPTSTGTGSYINGIMDHVSFNSSAIAVPFTYIEAQATTDISETKWRNMRFWFNVANGTGISITGAATRLWMEKPYFENFAAASATIGITIASGVTGALYFVGRPVFAGAGTWTGKIVNASNKFIHGTVETWREVATITPSATANTYGTAVTVLNGQTGGEWGSLPNLYVTIGGTLAASETITVEITLNTYSTWAPVVTKTYTATGTFPLTLADYIALTSNNFYFVGDNFSVRAKSTATSTTGTVAFGGIAGGTAESSIVNFAKTFNDGNFLLRNPLDTFSTTVKSGAQTAAAIFTYPVLGTKDTVSTDTILSTNNGVRKQNLRKRGSYSAGSSGAADGILGSPTAQGTATFQISYTAPAGKAIRFTTAGVSGDNAGLLWSGAFHTYRGWNPRLFCRFRIDSVTAQRTWIGLTNRTGAHPTGETELNSQTGILFGRRTTDTANWVVMYNDGSATALYTNIGGAPDTAVHTVEITTVDSVPAFYVSLDGGAYVTISGSQIPAQNTALTPVAEVEDSAGAAKAIDVHLVDLESDL